jgi:hypothetical protein
MDSNKLKVLKEKFEYLLRVGLTNSEFEIKEIDLDFDLTKTINGDTEIESYYIFTVVDYQGVLDGYEPYSFTYQLRDMLNKLQDSVSEYVILPEGKIVKHTNDDDVSLGDPTIVKINYELEGPYLFSIQIRAIYLD